MKTSPALRFLEANAWALMPRVFQALAEIIERHADGVRLDSAQIAVAIGREPTAAITDYGPDEREPAMAIVGSTAVVPMRGVLARYADQVNDISQPQGRSAESVQNDLRAALTNPAVARVVLRIDSPGGMVNGTAETAAMVRALQAAGKPVLAFVDGLAASAALWVAVACDSITASSSSALVGSIGIMGAVVEKTAPQGMKVTTVRSSPLKAPGGTGDTVTAEQLASVQRQINDLHAEFVAAVAEGRDLKPDGEMLAAATTGEVFTASRAKALGLVDDIQSWDAFMARANAPAPISAAGMSPEAPLAGITPATTPANPAGTDTMRITAQVLLALLASAPEHFALISSMATGDPAKGLQPASEDEIRTAITSAKSKALADRVTALESKATADADAHKTALAAKDAEIAALTAKVAKLSALGTAGKIDPGADHKAASVTGEASLRAEWEALDPAQKMGFCDDFDGFCAWKKNAHRDAAMADAAARERHAARVTENGTEQVAKDKG